MITLNNTEHKTDIPSKDTCLEMFKKEMDAYCAYKAWADDTDDEVLEMALEEIMEDEFLHARFLRDYMIDKEVYSLSADDPYEKRFWKAHKKFFRN